MQPDSENAARRVLVDVGPMVRRIASSKWPKSISNRTWRRWKSGKVRPNGVTVEAVALELWDTLHTAGGASVKDKVFEKLLELAPGTEVPDWSTHTDDPELQRGQRAQFVEWFQRLSGRSDEEPVPVPLAGTLELLVRDSGTGQYARVADKPSLLPAREGTVLRLRVTLNRSAYICIVWVDQHGKPWPIYPWDGPEGSWGSWLTFQRQAAVQVPSEGRAPLTVTGAPGIETPVLLASQREPTRHLLAHLQELLQMDSARPYQHDDRLKGRDRSPGSAIDDPIHCRHNALIDRLRSHFDVVLPVSFVNAGPSATS